MTSQTKEHVDWVPQKPLKVSDTIEVTISETSTVDEPTRRNADSPGQELEAKKDYVRRLAKDFGWKIQETPTKRDSKRGK